MRKVEITATPAVAQHRELQSAVEVAHAELADTLALATEDVTAEWDVADIGRQRPTLILRLRDSLATATGVLTPDELASDGLRGTRFRNLFMDLMGRGAKILIDGIKSVPEPAGVGG